MKPSNKAIVRAAQRICEKNGTIDEAGQAWNGIAARIEASMAHRSSIGPARDKARLAMLKSIIEGNDIITAQADALRAVEL